MYGATNWGEGERSMKSGYSRLVKLKGSRASAELPQILQLIPLHEQICLLTIKNHLSGRVFRAFVSYFFFSFSVLSTIKTPGTNNPFHLTGYVSFRFHSASYIHLIIFQHLCLSPGVDNIIPLVTL